MKEEWEVACSKVTTPPKPTPLAQQMSMVETDSGDSSDQQDSDSYCFELLSMLIGVWLPFGTELVHDLFVLLQFMCCLANTGKEEVEGAKYGLASQSTTLSIIIIMASVRILMAGGAIQIVKKCYVDVSSMLAHTQGATRCVSELTGELTSTTCMMAVTWLVLR